MLAVYIVLGILAALLFIAMFRAIRKCADMSYLGIDMLDLWRATIGYHGQEFYEWCRIKIEEKIEERYTLLGYRLRNTHQELTTSDEYPEFDENLKNNLDALVDHWLKVFSGELSPPETVTRYSLPGQPDTTHPIDRFLVKLDDITAEHQRLQNIIKRWNLYQDTDDTEGDDGTDAEETPEENS